MPLSRMPRKVMRLGGTPALARGAASLEKKGSKEERKRELSMRGDGAGRIKAL